MDSSASHSSVFGTSGTLQDMKREIWTPAQSQKPHHTTCPAGKMCWSNGGTKLVGVANQRLVYLEAALQEGALVGTLLDTKKPKTGQPRDLG